MVPGLRQAFVLLVVAGAVALAVAGVWTALGGGDFRVRTAIVLLGIALVISVSGNAVLTRSGTAEVNALLGRGPEHGEPAAAGG